MTDKLNRREVLASLATGGVVAAGLPSTALSAQSVSSSMDEPKLFDSHQHVELADATFSVLDTAALIAKDYEARSRSMDENGIAQSVLFAASVYRQANGIEDTRRVNDLIATYVSKHSDRFPVGLGIVEMKHGDASLRELERMAKDLKLRGAAWHHAQCGVAIDHPSMRPILKTMQELQLVPFMHVHWRPYESIDRLEVVAEEFPEITFVALAALATREDTEQAAQIAKRRKNILFDTGPIVFDREIGIERFVKRFGANRVLFGSDLYAMQPSYRKPTTTLEVIRNSHITNEEKALILRGNVVRLFRL
jgi:predicted TIM-barrel fold metal-dependent hydrolase